MWRKKIIFPVFLFVSSFICSAVLCEYKGDQWEEIVRKYYYKIFTRHSIPSSHKTVLDKKGIPLISYPAANGIKPVAHYNPTLVGVYAIHYYRRFKKTSDSLYKFKFFNCVRWLEENRMHRDNFAIYEFDWQQPFYPSVKTPWTSSLSSAFAMDVFMDAYKINPLKKYLALSNELLRGFYYSAGNGGFTCRDSTGWWYEEYASVNSKTPRVMNGHIFSILAVKKFWNITKNDSAYFVYAKGMESLRNNIKKYDAGNGWSYYDGFGKRADKHYQKVHVNLMRALWKITGDSLFFHYYKKWKAPMEKPYFIRIINEKNRSGIILFAGVGLLAMIIFTASKTFFRNPF